MYKLPEDVMSKYRFVTLAAKRAEQLQLGALPRVEEPKGKPTVIAQAEVAGGLVEPWDPDQEVELAEAGVVTEEEEE